VASWLVRLSPDRAVRVQALAGDIMLCSWATIYSHSAYIRRGLLIGTGEFNAGGYPAMDQHLIQGGVEILLVASRWSNLR